MRSFVAILKISALLVWTVPLASTQIVLLFFTKGKKAYYIPRFWHKGVAAIVGLRTEIAGSPVHDKQVIYASNHLSYLDVPAIGSYLLASFIAKQDVSGWPVMGFLARVQQTAFISRTSSHAKKVANALDEMIREGKSLILFPEGTSSDGISVLPFKSSLFALVTAKYRGNDGDDMPPIPIQPFILELVGVNGAAPTKESRDLYSWYGDMEFGPHIWDFLKNKGAVIRMTFLPVITPQEGQNRKDVCRLVENAIQSGLNGADTV